MKPMLLLAAVAGALFAQALEGTWQGTLTPNPNVELRLAFKIDKSGNVYEGRFYNLANGRQFNLGTITLQGTAVKIVIPGNGMNYEGKLEADGNSITGSLLQGANPTPLPLKRATSETAWELPPPPAAPKGVAAGAKLEFEVATIKPSVAGQPGPGGFNVTTRELRSRNTSLADLIVFALRVHRTQIAGLPGWAESERYDIVASLPAGDPTDPELFAMLQNLMKSRFNLAFHTEKRELSVYAIGLGKGGQAGIKMTKNDTNGVRVGAQALGRVVFSGTTMADLASQLQFRVLDRPVIDQSGLTDRYDFALNWTPDEFQFPAATAAQRSAIPSGPDAPPDLFTAVQEQLGLKLEAVKAPADVLVIEQVSRPSEN
jgi:uncharacterized protein (TIGR03435 family)